jgi:type III secretion system (T3SS) inner membrane Yop/YscD-like protein
MRLSCPSCGGGFDVADDGVKATARCPSCGRVVVARDASLVSPQGEATVPHDAERAGADPVTRADYTAVGAAGLALPEGRRVSLAFLNGPRQGDVVVLQSPSVRLGRAGAGADLEIEDPEVSRSHAVIECHGLRVVLRDAGSRFGTFVEDERVQERDLTDRTEFRLGSTRLLLTITEVG